MNWFIKALLKIGVLKLISCGFRDKMPIRGKLHIQLWDEKGCLKDERFLTNTVTAVCDAHVADQMNDSGDSASGYMAVGTGSGF